MNARGERTVRKIRLSTEPQWKIKFKSELPGSSNKNQREGGEMEREDEGGYITHFSLERKYNISLRETIIFHDIQLGDEFFIEIFI